MVDIEKFKSLGFNKSQIKQIEIGMYSGLSDADIERFAKKEYPSTKMERVRKALEYGFTDEQIELYTDKKYDYNVAEEIRRGFENGLSMEDVKLYLNPIYCGYLYGYLHDMSIAREFLEDCNKGVFNKFQANQIRLGMKHGVSVKGLKKYAQPKYSAFCMMYMRLGFENNLSKEQMKILDSAISSMQNSFQIDEILSGMIHHLTKEQVLKYAKRGYSAFFMQQIRLAYEHDCTDEQVDYLISKIDKDFHESNLVDWDGFPELHNPYEIAMLKHSDNPYGNDMASELRLYFELGLSLESVQKVFDNIHHYADIRLIRLALCRGYSFDEVINVFKKDEYFTDNQRDVLFHAIAHKLPIDCVALMLNRNFDYLQMIEMLEGFLAHLSSEQVSVYAYTGYDYLQMAEMRTGFICGLSIDEVKQYADPELTSVEMALKRAEILSAK